tara:strand:+ start:301 stop:594 length:294 start_codon:yes stop_codon:yes gene_type:complete
MVIDHFTPIAEARGISLRAATKASPQRWLMVTSLMAAFFTTLPSFFGGSWLALFATPQVSEFWKKTQNEKIFLTNNLSLGAARLAGHCKLLARLLAL